MQNKLIKMGVVAAMVMAGVSAAHAGEQPTVTISGDVTAVSCTVNADAPHQQVSLGNRLASDFKDGSGIYSDLKIVNESKKQFSVGLSGCSGTSAQGGVVSLIVNGTTIAGSSSIYNGEGSSGPSGASLAAPETAGGTTDVLVKNGDAVPVYTFVSGDATGAAADAHSVLFTTYMATTKGSTVVPQHIQAPINFSIAYN